MNIKVLIIEDDPGVADRLKTAIDAKLKILGHETEIEPCVDFSKAGGMLRRFRPHAVVLDLKKDPFDDHAAKPAWDVIRDEHFCPVLFYSAVPMPEEFPQNDLPFANYLHKSADENGNETAAAERLSSFVPHIEGLQELWNDVERRYAKSVTRVSKLIWESEPEGNRAQALIRVTRRRLAATLDHPIGAEINIKAWEQFVYPPTDENHLCTGDVVFQRGADCTKAGSFRIVLTPPCDLIPGQNAVSEVLLGKCLPVADAEVFRRAGIQVSQSPTTKLAEKLAKDEVVGLKIIPKLSDLWPTMVLDFKSLQLVPRASIALSPEAANDTSVFERIASMDSPFREALSWRFMQTAGRPGTPDVDRNAFETEIKAAN